jgi:hypothetical protein
VYSRHGSFRHMAVASSLNLAGSGRARMLEARLNVPIPGFWSFPARAALHAIVGGGPEHLLLLSNGRMARVIFRYLTEGGHERYKSIVLLLG